VNSLDRPPRGGPFVLLAIASVTCLAQISAPAPVTPGPIALAPERPDVVQAATVTTSPVQAPPEPRPEEEVGPEEEPPPPPPEPRRLTPLEGRQALALARICVSEAGFTLRTRDCELIYHVLRTRSRSGELEMGTMRAYCKKSFNRDRTDHHRWVAHLNPAGREPRGWSETTTVPWSRRRAAWLRVLEHTRDLIRRRPENPCGDRLDHWGSKGFRRRRHLRNGWRIVDCGETLNEFWALPDRFVR
jgi:hypothetical protein